MHFWLELTRWTSILSDKIDLEQKIIPASKEVRGDASSKNLQQAMTRHSSSKVIEAMRLRILEVWRAIIRVGNMILIIEASQLEDQITTHPPAKRARTSTTAEASSSNAGSSSAVSKAEQKQAAALSKAEEKKTKMQLKKIFDR